MAYTNSSRELPNRTETAVDKANGDDDDNNNNGSSLGDCWNAITEIKSCANEIVEYFKNGTTDIGTPCCQAIKVIALHCWPAMLTALGFTSDQYNVLVGYCDASAAPAPSPSVVPAPKTNKTMV